MKERITDYHPKDWITHCREQALLLSIEKRQEFINYMWNEHLSVGDASKKADLNFDEAAGIMNMQIKQRRDMSIDWDGHIKQNMDE